MKRPRTIALTDGARIPQLGVGMWQVPDAEAASVVCAALEVGYRHVDTAAIYGNEHGVGAGLRHSSVERSCVFITTKLWNAQQGRRRPMDALRRSCERLGVDAVDLYLIHWPVPARDRYVDSWRALVEARELQLVHSIGVSNFDPVHLERIIDATGVIPVVNQVELHPYLQQRELRALHDELGIRTEGWSPLGRGSDLLEHATVQTVAAELDCTPAQVVLAWHLAHGLITIPKSRHEARLAENFAASQVVLTPDHIARIDALDRGEDGRIGPNPATADFE